MMTTTGACWRAAMACAYRKSAEMIPAARRILDDSKPGVSRARAEPARIAITTKTTDISTKV